MDVSQYMAMFLEESREHLQTLNSSLLEIENDPTNHSVLDEIFRSAHTIKGMSATMGFTTIAELTHVMENVLDMIRKDSIIADHGIVDILFQCVDTLEQLVENVAEGEESTLDIKPLLAKLNDLAQGKYKAASNAGHKEPVIQPQVEEELIQPGAQSNALENGGSELQSEAQPKTIIQINEFEKHVIQTAREQGLQAYEVNVELNADCLLKSARAYMVMSALEELGEVIESVPAVEELEKGNFELSFHVLIVSDSENDKIEQTVSSISEISTVTALPVVFPAESDQEENQPEHTPPGDLEKTATQAGSALVSANNIKPPAKDGKQQAAAAEHHDKKLKSGQSVRVDIDKLDTLLNLVGELVMNKTRLGQIGITHRLTDLVETIEQMNRVTDDLQAIVMKVRMVPVGQVFNRFPRMVRDLSRELNKDLNLVIQGEETELDRTVIDEIGDPLVHLLRNAIDHGIEHPSERQAKGKKPVGEIRLIARHEGNNVIIMVEDDGQGINPDIVKQKAIEKGLLTPAEAEKMDAAEAVRIVFLPGFSTNEVVTDVSGRGVGMDAVKTKIEALGGMVDVETKLNEGSKFKIRLPLTLAIIQALLVKVYEEIYAIPLGSIDSTTNITPDDIKTIQNQEVILLRGQIIPIVRLANSLNVPCVGEKDREELAVVVVHVGDNNLGIIVDSLIGQQEIVIKSMGKLLAGIKVIAGATILGNGQVALILDVGALKQA